MSKKPLIISTDPGIDDIAAMTISLFADELDVKMIVPTWGNVSLAHTLQNTLDLENFLHTKVPVVKGANSTPSPMWTPPWAATPLTPSASLCRIPVWKPV